jgi:hypothetical protein
MASDREMDAAARDPARVLRMCLGLLAMAEADENIFTPWELHFLEDLAEKAEEILGLSRKDRKKWKDSLRPDQARLAQRGFRFTVLQMEKLFEIYDASVLYKDIRGISVRNLINRCHEARCDLDEGDEEFVERLYSSGVAELRRNDLARLKRCSVQLGELEEYMMM